LSITKFEPDLEFSIFTSANIYCTTDLVSTADHIINTKYEELFRSYFSSLCYFAHKYIRDFDTCKEIVHNVFVNIWEKRDEFDFNQPAKSYLFTAVYNRSMNHLRDRKKFVNDSVEDFIYIPDENALQDKSLEAAELEAKIWKVINSLPEACKKIFMLNRFEGKKYAEIAEDLNISVKTVETQMSKALKTLREHLIDYIHLLVLFLIKFL
jgi:RNA polymerase sigma-70 factor, ECF subfamily